MRFFCCAPCMRKYLRGASPCHNLVAMKYNEAHELTRKRRYE